MYRVYTNNFKGLCHAIFWQYCHTRSRILVILSRLMCSFREFCHAWSRYLWGFSYARSHYVFGNVVTLIKAILDDFVTLRQTVMGDQVMV